MRITYECKLRRQPEKCVEFGWDESKGEMENERYFLKNPKESCVFYKACTIAQRHWKWIIFSGMIFHEVYSSDEKATFS